jgi:hypothetical protein
MPQSFDGFVYDSHMLMLLGRRLSNVHRPGQTCDLLWNRARVERPPRCPAELVAAPILLLVILVSRTLL